MIDAIAGIESTVAGHTFAGYQQSWLIRRAIERGIEIIAEASRHIPEDLKEQHPHIYWREIAAMAISSAMSMDGSTIASCGASSKNACRS